MRVHWLQHVPFEGLGSIDAWLCARGARVSSTRFHESADLPDVATLDLVVAMGGPMSVNDDARLPWLSAEREFIARAVSRGTSVLGVCLGAQLMARALGAPVYRNTEKEIGWWPITGMADDANVPAWARKGAESTVFHWHGETFDLPPGATWLARSEACAHQAFQLGRRAIGVQFHLETTPPLARGLVDHCPEDLTPARFVQTGPEIAGAGEERFARINRHMVETLEYLCG